MGACEHPFPKQDVEHYLPLVMFRYSGWLALEYYRLAENGAYNTGMFLFLSRSGLTHDMD